jgi:hypothetical protein
MFAFLAVIFLLEFGGGIAGEQSPRSMSAQKPDRALVWREQYLNGGILSLDQKFGRALFTRCQLAVVYFQPHMKDTDRLELSCTPNVHPRVDDVMRTRLLTPAESETVARLANAADLYGGGHIGNYSVAGSDGPSERLEVHRCCRRTEQVILITTGNPTFSIGARRELLTLLNTWRQTLFDRLIEPNKRDKPISR